MCVVHGMKVVNWQVEQTPFIGDTKNELLKKSEDQSSKNSTLVVGINIDSTPHYARAFDWRGIKPTNHYRVDIGSCFKNEGILLDIVNINPCKIRSIRTFQEE